ncbi:carnitine O-palmitoyltransferase II, putative [Trypanosoma equiperdum]|uniref:Carnitine O-acetyltransferase, mitochondrial n=2 Tax=Trypanozoon TaxID=39700 RepID=Q57WC6_TRYB2|nr:carnitine O-palmitoyltransferase II, putative [Trypanosoma brucei brucei TREU927]AAX70107.1 carnitine O-palmitoyltransferase II, putative [Trypanosoma brucei]AAZ10423.1 carnitine O-palmitoyltransferase II, putative [Trypanosoma brucei brucei TREU927]SCU66088.1 carnitine O-palmitoyltransferase II, putative [Trypanosoma equiperdum]
MKRIPVKDLAVNVLKLPRLPIPTLEATAERYRASIWPLKSAEMVKNHLQKFDTFLTSSAGGLQAALVEADTAAAACGVYPYSYIEALWEDMYLSNREPVLVNVNPAITTKKLKNAGDTQAAVGAAVVHSIARWVYNAVNKGVEVFDETRDVSPLLRQFGASVIPGEKKDTFHTTPMEKLRHIIVLHDGHPYAVRVFDDKQVPLDRAVVQKSIEYVLSITPDADNTTPVSVLTAGNRQTWAGAYAELVKTPENAENLKKIQEGIVVVCLDTESWGGDGKLVDGASLHGNNTEFENRWYDKHQIIVSADGRVAFNFEHSGSDGVQWLRWISDIISDVEGGDGSSVSTSATSLDPAKVGTLVQPLTLTFGKTFAAHIRAARAGALELIAGTALEDVTIPYGKTQLKQLGVSPDAFVQMCLQVAHHKCRNKLAPTYEAASTGRFFHGRTETIRSATREMQLVAEAVNRMTKANAASDEEGSTTYVASVEEQVALLKAAAERHVRLAKAAANGEGIDRHLTALKRLAVERNDAAALAFFNDETYTSCSTWRLSTSNLTAPWVERFMFGPVTANGYGLGYTIDGTEVRLTVSAFTRSPSTDAGDMKLAVSEAASNVYGLLKAGTKLK